MAPGNDGPLFHADPPASPDIRTGASIRHNASSSKHSASFR